MDREENVNLGSVQIHKKVIADLVSSAIEEIDGVGLVSEDFQSAIMDLFGKRYYSGITVTVDKNSQVSIEIKVVVRYGVNIPEMARKVQDTVRKVIDKAVDIDLKDINVNIQGIERGGER
ncbi:MAG: Asp23/Gls24 family envelope stress response protein [Candidatus Omnitrophota bacterium]